jgi:hypothetical protein
MVWEGRTSQASEKGSGSIEIKYFKQLFSNLRYLKRLTGNRHLPGSSFYPCIKPKPFSGVEKETAG